MFQSFNRSTYLSIPLLSLIQSFLLLSPAPIWLSFVSVCFRTTLFAKQPHKFTWTQYAAAKKKLEMGLFFWQQQQLYQSRPPLCPTAAPPCVISAVTAGAVSVIDQGCCFWMMSQLLPPLLSVWTDTVDLKQRVGGALLSSVLYSILGPREEGFHS